MKKFLIAGSIIVLLFIIVASAKKEPGSETPEGAATTTTSMAKFSDPSLKDPVIKDGAFFPDAKWGDPSVISVNGTFIMYASAGKGISSGDIDIYRFQSSDGISWEMTPNHAVLENATEASAQDRKAVETPSVVVLNGIYHMFYTAYPKDFRDFKAYKIMHATSADGITWTKDPAIILSPTNPNSNTPNMDFNQWISAEPGAVVFNNQIYLYFAASGANQITQSDLFTIGLTTSSDGKTWSKPQMVLMPDQSIYPRAKYQGYSTPGATVRNGKVELFFDVIEANPFHQFAIRRAVSSDGKTNWALDPSPLLTTKDYAWASGDVVSPAPLYVNDKLYMWFSGHTGNTLGIGLYREQ
jgi:predicted GH43/DUF377 family glycosyl hydrolase